VVRVLKSGTVLYETHAHISLLNVTFVHSCFLIYSIQDINGEGLLSLRFLYWVVAENIHTHTTGGISEFRKGGGLHQLEFRGHGGFIGLEFRRHGGFFQESNFQFGVVTL